MRIPFSWLKNYVAIPDNAELAAQKLKRVGVPVERIEQASNGISGVYSGKILKLEAHPNADKLRIASVDIGHEKLQIITGASNVKEGDTIPVARIGASLAHGKTIKETSLRGLPSYGMMCSADELALSVKDYLPVEQQTGVMILDSDTKPGIDLSNLLGLNESILILEPFANRPDYLSIFGIAREAAAIYDLPLKFPELYPEESGNLSGKVNVDVQDFQACSRYTARYVSGAKVKPSPLWMAVRLHAAGVRPINNIVDITNYVLLELGQPLHAFDYKRLQGKTILVRKAVAGEKLKAIDEKIYDLTEDMLVIADHQKPIALAGVMGGKESEISESSSEILLESAHFDPGTIRRTSLKLGLRTESSRRFEKGLDPVAADWGSRRACHLIKQTGAEIIQGVEDIHKKIPAAREISVNMDRVRKIIGVDKLQQEHAEKILSALGFAVLNKNPLLVQPPALRCDIHEEIDVAEEVARHLGYDQIPSILPSGITTPGKLDPEETFEKKLQSLLSSFGLTEMVTYSLGDPLIYRKLELEKFALVQNPLTEDRKALRPFLYPGLLTTVKKNLSVKNKDLALFEIGKIFEKNNEIFEKRNLCILITGKIPWNADPSFFTLKGMLEALWDGLHIAEPFHLKTHPCPAFHPHRQASIHCKEKSIGLVGQMHPLILEEFEIDQPVFILEMSADELQLLEVPVPKHKPLPLYPESRRDISMIVEEQIPAGNILALARETGGTVVEDVKIFDVYQGPQVPQGKKSLAFSVTYRSPDKTLTDEEVTSLHEKIKKELASRFQAQIRE